MEWGKIKNVILLLLVLVNAFLLFLVVARREQASRYRQGAVEDIVAVFQKNGISLDPARIPEETAAPLFRVERDAAMERRIAQALLGDVNPAAPGGGITFYSGDGGAAEFRNNGEFSIQLAEGAPLPDGDLWEHARTLLAAMGIEGVAENDYVLEADGVLQLTMRQYVSGLPVFSCDIVFQWGEDGLRTISGRRLLGAPVPSEGGETAVSAITALVRFLDEISSAGDICTEITHIGMGFRIPSTSLGEMLVPVWRIATDTGTYYIDAVAAVADAG